MMKRFLILTVLAAVLFAGCRKKDIFTVEGSIESTDSKYIYLNRLEVNTPVPVDSAKINDKGRFRFRIKATGPDFYQLGLSQEDFITLLAEPGEKITLRFGGKNLFEDYSVEGSEGSEKVRFLDVSLTKTRKRLDSLSYVFNNRDSSSPDFEKRGAELQSEFTSLLKEQRRRNVEFIIANLRSMASIKAIYQRIDQSTYVLYDPKDLQYLKLVTDTLTKYYPESRHVQALAADFTNQMKRFYTSQLQELANSLPETRLDPDLMTAEGRRVRLSSLKGKYVLLSFWSVRSGDCIAENLQLKELYKQYNKRGFEVYQINIDENEEAWKAAIRFDELPWINAREEDPANPYNARLYNVKSVPANFLYDREGKIIATNLHGKALQIKMEQIFQTGN